MDEDKRAHLGIQSGVSASSEAPYVYLIWGEEVGQLTPFEARDYAFGILEASISAELDACLYVWAQKKLGASKREAVELIKLFREKQKGKPPRVRLNIDGDMMNPDTAKLAGVQILEMALGAVVESFLVEMIVKDFKKTPETADKIIQEFREMRGVETLWPEQENEFDKS